MGSPLLVHFSLCDMGTSASTSASASSTTSSDGAGAPSSRPSLLSGDAPLVPFGLSDVSLTSGSRLHSAAVVNARYVLSIPVDSLLYIFRQYAGLDTKGAKPLGGWESPSSGSRGHFAGHTLSALSKASVTLRITDPDIAASCLANATSLVAGLAECQKAIGASLARLSADDDDDAPPLGYLNAQSPAQFDRLETLQQADVPYYVIHKIMEGLLDAYTYTGNQQAVAVVSAMADYHAWRFSRLSQWTIDQMINTRRYSGQAPAYFMEHVTTAHTHWCTTKLRRRQ